MRKLLTICLLSLIATTAMAAYNAKAHKVLAIIDRVNTYWQANNSAEVRSFWDNAAYHTGNMEAYFLTGEQRYLDYSLRWAEHNKWMGATESDPAKWEYKTYGEDQRHVLFGDWQICFQTYIDLYWVAMGSYVPGRKIVSTPVAVNPSQRIARAKEVMQYEAYSAANDY